MNDRAAALQTLQEALAEVMICALSDFPAEGRARIGQLLQGGHAILRFQIDSRGLNAIPLTLKCEVVGMEATEEKIISLFDVDARQFHG